MRTRIQKWGNSLALRIPRTLANEAHLDDNTPVDLLLVDQKLTIIPLTGPRASIAELLERVADGQTARVRHVWGLLETSLW